MILLLYMQFWKKTHHQLNQFEVFGAFFGELGIYFKPAFKPLMYPFQGWVMGCGTHLFADVMNLSK